VSNGFLIALFWTANGFVEGVWACVCDVS